MDGYRSLHFDYIHCKFQYPVPVDHGGITGSFGTITANPSSTDGYYNAGQSVQLTANANGGYQFSSWSGDASWNRSRDHERRKECHPPVPECG
ncbi:MAG: hypothetical protein HY820_08375 [Acidobacteria bacterium]|nr:hypothetical protein [Acidobacteriota bacterium]